MIFFPKVGDECWIVVSVRGSAAAAIPVTVAERGNVYAIKNRTPEGVTFNLGYNMSLTVQHKDDVHFILESYEVGRRGLFKTQRRAARVADRLNRKAARI